MVATASLRQELAERGFRKLGFWTRGVDTELFTPDHPAKLDLPRPIFMTMGRVAVEKNLEAFLVARPAGHQGRGRRRAAAGCSSQQKYPDAVFLGEKKGADLTAHLAAADVFVFPSLTDTFGVVQLEALACGTPVAAFPVTGSARRHRRSSDRRDRLGSAQRLPARADHVARDLPEFCAGAFLGKQRAAVHRQSGGAAAQPRVASRSPAHGRRPARCTVRSQHLETSKSENESWQTS